MSDEIKLLRKRMKQIVEKTDIMDLINFLDTSGDSTSSPKDVEKMLHRLPSYYAVVSHLYDICESEIEDLKTSEELYRSRLFDYYTTEIFKENKDEGMTASASKPTSKIVDGRILQEVAKKKELFDLNGDKRWKQAEKLVLEEDAPEFEETDWIVPLTLIQKKIRERRDEFKLLSTLKRSWDKKIDTAVSTVNLIGHLLKKNMYVVKDNDGFESVD